MKEKKNTIMIVDDEDSIRRMVSVFLDASDFKIEECTDGKQAIRLIPSIKPDLVLLDLGLPDIDGKEVIGAIRAWSQVPVIILSARDDDTEIAEALNVGADDYIVKPFNPTVLLARINANLRKSAVRDAGEPEIINGPIRMDLVRHEVFIRDQKIALTPKEYDLLRFFITHRGKMLTHRQILKEVWGPAHVEDAQYLRVYIGQLRDKMAANDVGANLIINEPGIGYRMETMESEAMAKSA
jgi:two-component system, OmpR family, KDP operon response regulator KdpE